MRAGLVQMGLPAEVIEAVVEIKTRFVTGAFDILTTDVERLSGQPARSLRAVLSSTKAG